MIFLSHFDILLFFSLKIVSTVNNVCAFHNGGCSPYATCAQFATGNVTCTCRRDYEGDGVICRPIDACQVENGGCHPTAKCTMTGPVSYG